MGLGKAVVLHSLPGGVEHVRGCRGRAVQRALYAVLALGKGQNVEVEELGPWYGQDRCPAFLEAGDVQGAGLPAQDVELACVQKDQTARARLRFLEQGRELRCAEAEDIVNAREIQGGKAGGCGLPVHAHAGYGRDAAYDGRHEGGQHAGCSNVAGCYRDNGPGCREDRA